MDLDIEEPHSILTLLFLLSIATAEFMLFRKIDIFKWE